MKISLNHMKWQKPFIVILILAHLMGCTHWKLLKEPYNEQIKNDKPKRIQVESVYGRKIILKNPHIVGNILCGIYERDDPITFKIKSDTIHVALSEIEQIKIETINPYTVVCLGGFLIALLIFGIMVDLSFPAMSSGPISD